jgi:hypothetical protein
MTGRLAQLFRAADKVEDVIDDLEGGAEVAAELAQRLNLVFGRLAEHRAHLRRAGEKRGRLSIDAALVFVARLVEPLRVEHLHQLTVAKITERGCEDRDRAGIVGRGRQHRRLGEKVVADQDDGARAELGIERRFSPPQRRFVDGIVVDQRCGMKELDARGSRDDRLEVLSVSEAAGGEEQEEWAQPLAAGLDNIAQERRNDRVVDLGRLQHPCVHALEISTHRPEHIRSLKGQAVLLDSRE